MVGIAECPRRTFSPDTCKLHTQALSRTLTSAASESYGADVSEAAFKISPFDLCPHHVSQVVDVHIHRSHHGFLHNSAYMDCMLQNVGISVAAFSSALRKCNTSIAYMDSKLLHHHLIFSHGASMFADLLVEMYCRCGSLQDAVACLITLHEARVYSWNFTIQAHIRKGDGRGALALLNHMLHVGVEPNEITLLHILSDFQSLDDPQHGRWIHAFICECGFEGDVHLQTSLIRMYGKHSNLSDVRWMFADMRTPDIVTWNVMLNVFSHHEMEEEVLRLFCEMLRREVRPNKVTCICMLGACGGEEIFDKGRFIHAYILENMLALEMEVLNALLSMYARSATLQEAINIFSRMTVHSVVSWTIMIQGFALHGKACEALDLFAKMQQERITPDRVIYVSLVQICADHGMLMEGMLLHASVVSTSLENDVAVGNAAISMYGNCGCLNEAIEAFHSMLTRDVITWTGMIAAYIHHAQCPKAIHIFERMRQEGVEPSKVTYVCVLEACAKRGALAHGLQVHTCISMSELIEDIDVRNSLINMYGKCGNLQYSWEMFKNIEEKNVVSWTAMITVLCHHGLVEEAMNLFNDMQQEGVNYNEITLGCILDTCSKQVSLVKGKQVHACIVSSQFEQDVAVGNSLIYMYQACSDLEHVQMVFSKMARRNVISWTAMITAYTSHGKATEALFLYESMDKQGIRPDRVALLGILDACMCCADLMTGEHMLHDFFEGGFEFDHVIRTACINLYGKCGNLKDARRIFEGMQQQAAVVSWTVMISICALHGECQEALKLLQKMQLHGIEPDELTFVGILSACSHCGVIDGGERIFIAMIEEYRIFPSTELYVCMVDLFGRAGRLDEAEALLKCRSVTPTSEILMALLGACRYKGDISRGERYANMMFHVDPTNAAPYVMLWNIFAVAEKEDSAIVVEQFESPKCAFL